MSQQKMAHHRGSSIKNSGLPGALGARGKLRPSDSMESGLGPPGNRGLAAHDLTKVFLTLQIHYYFLYSKIDFVDRCS